LLCREVLGSARRGNCCGMHLFRLWFRSEMLRPYRLRHNHTH
jgi:hypothetical protein